MAAADVTRHEAFALLDAQAWDQARAAFLNLLESDEPDPEKIAEVWLGLCRAFAGLGQAKESTRALAKAFAIAPRHQEVALAAARQLNAEGSPARAVEVIQHALNESPGSTQLLRLLIETADLAGDWGQALQACYTLAQATPADPAPLLRAAQIRLRDGNFADAEKDLRAAVAADPKDSRATDSLANLLRVAGNLDEARSTLMNFAASAGDSVSRAVVRFKAAFMQPVVARSETELDAARERFAEALAAGPETPIEDPYLAGFGPNFFLNYQARDDRALHEELAAYYLAATPSLEMHAPHLGVSVKGRRIRVGILSAYFTNQTVGYLNYGLVTALDRARFEVILFRPAQSIQDQETARFRTAARMVDLPADLAGARTAIAAERLDILHFPEIGMDPFTYFIAFARLATVQTVGWGHPVTTGLPHIDHFLSVEDMEPSDAQAHYRENLVRMKGLSFAGERVTEPNFDGAELGLAPGPSYVCLQSLCKVHPRFDAILAQILAKDLRGSIYFLSNGAVADGLLVERLSKSLGSRTSSIKVLPRLSRPAFLALARAADVALDVPEWSGGRTSLETFAMGTPIVHLPGQFMRGRHTLAFYRRMGVTTPIVGSPADYADMAVRLVHDEGLRNETRRQIAQAQTRLFEDWASIREVEDVWAALVAART